jgi:serine protease Do
VKGSGQEEDHEAKIVGIHEPHDLALLKIEATGLRPVEWASSKAAAVGHWVASAGPKEDPVAVGVVSVATRNVPAVKGPAVTPNPRAGYLGVALDAGDGGVRVMQVMPNTPASKAGFKVNDLILTLAGKAVAQPDQFMAIMQKHRPGDEVTLTIRRGEEEVELKATLTKRPVARGDMQNAMGSELSQRKTGFPTILQHDSVIKPSDCGSPLVDLEGRVVGLNICRWGRTETYAVPAEVIQKVLPDLMAGKLAPKMKETEPAPKEEKTPAKKSGTSAEQEVDRLLHLVKERLLLMPDVARAKWNAGRPIVDLEREQAFLKAMIAKGAAHGLEAEFTRSFFRRAA